jgi:sugar phosphate isomerase/epimerase
MVPGGTLTDKAKRLADWGYDGIAIFTDRESWNEKLLNELLNLQKETGVKACEFVFTGDVYGHLMDKKNNTHLKARAMYKETIEVCKMLGAITEMEFEYCIQDPMPLFNPYALMSRTEEEEFIEVVRDLSSLVEGSDAYLLIEPINRYESRYLNRLSDCKKIVESFNNNNLGLLPDFFHMSIEETDFVGSILEAGSYIKHVHIGDSNRLQPGYGRTDWPSCIKALNDIGFTGYMNLECGITGDPEVELPETARFLKNLICSVKGE